MKRVVVLTSNKYRHRYFIDVVNQNFNLTGLITEEKNNYYTQQKEESQFISEHFKSLSKYEKKYFGDIEYPNVDTLHLNKQEINTTKVKQWAVDKKPDLILLFGTGILDKDWLNLFHNKIINTHLGLSPYYRGTATLFWPFVNKELECVGTTIHIAAEKVDAGDIIARIKPDITLGDNYYDINMKAIKKSIDVLPHVMEKYFTNTMKLIKQDITQSKLYKKSDFNEDVLIAALDFVKNGITKELLDNIKGSKKCSCCQ